jgi:hypothetical protein
VVGIGRDPLAGGILHRPAGVEGGLELGDGRGVRQVALVVLDGEGNAGEVVPVLGQVLVQVLHRLDVGVHPLDLAVGDEHHAVHALEDQLPGGVVVDLARHGVEMEPGLESPDRAQVHRQKIEEQGAVRLRREGDHLPRAAGATLLYTNSRLVVLPPSRGRSRRACS